MGLEKNIEEIKDTAIKQAQLIEELLTLSRKHSELPVKVSVVSKEMGFKSTATLKNLIRSGKIPHHKLGGSLMVFRSEVVNALETVNPVIHVSIV